MPNGDIVTGDYAGVVRVWTCDGKRRASPQELKKLEDALKKSAKSTKVDPLSCPPYEDRAQYAGKEGAVKMFRQGLAKVVIWYVFQL